jgi:hypothetical protein
MVPRASSASERAVNKRALRAGLEGFNPAKEPQERLAIEEPYAPCMRNLTTLYTWAVGETVAANDRGEWSKDIRHNPDLSDSLHSLRLSFFSSLCRHERRE